MADSLIANIKSSQQIERSTSAALREAYWPNTSNHITSKQVSEVFLTFQNTGLSMKKRTTFLCYNAE